MTGAQDMAATAQQQSGISGMSPYELGRIWNVKIDPDDPSKVVFSQEASARAYRPRSTTWRGPPPASVTNSTR